MGDLIERTETTNPSQSPGDEFQYVDVSSVSNQTFEIEETQKLLGKDAPSRARKSIKSGDILFATIRPTLQRIAIVPEILHNQVCSTAFVVLRPRSGIEGRFLFYSLFSPNFSEQMSALQKGASYPAVTDGEVKDQLVAVPPLPEQQRIVTILDEAFEAIATAKANTEKNLQNARNLFAQHVQSVFSQRGDDWIDKTLGQIAQVKGGKRVPKGYKLLSEPTAYPYLRVTDFTSSGSIDMSDLQYISADIYKQIKNYTISSRDMYLSIAGTIGKTGIIPQELEGANLTENACRLVFREGISNRFVYYFSITPDFVEQAGLNTRTSAQPKLALSRLATINLGLPNLAEQERLADEFDTLRDQTDSLENLYQHKLVALEELKKSLLHQAFTGNL